MRARKDATRKAGMSEAMPERWAGKIAVIRFEHGENAHLSSDVVQVHHIYIVTM